MRAYFVGALVISGLLVSCTGNKHDLITLPLNRMDYADMIRTTGTIQAVHTTPIMAPMDYFGELKVAWAIPEGSRVEKGDTILVMECQALMQMLEKQNTELEVLHADLKKLEADQAMNRAMLDASLKENQAAMAIAQLDSVQIRFAPPVRQQLMALELEKARIQERKLLKKNEASKKIGESEIRQLKSRILQTENRIQTFQEQVNGLTILAPKSGVVTMSEMQGRILISFGDGDPIELGGYPREGSLVFPELPLMQLPELDEIQILAKVQEVDYKRIEKGMKVDIRVDAQGELHTTGSVLSKAITGKSDYGSKVKWFDVIVQVDSCHLKMPPGLSARCEIFINQVIDTVVVPTVAIFERDSQSVVYVEDKGRFQPIPVKTGLTNGSQSVITSGLTGYETIALEEPPHNRIRLIKQKTHE